MATTADQIAALQTSIKNWTQTLTDAPARISLLNGEINHSCGNKDGCGKEWYKPNCYSDTKNPSDMYSETDCTNYTSQRTQWQTWQTSLPAQIADAQAQIKKLQASSTIMKIVWWTLGIAAVIFILFILNRKYGLWSRLTTRA